MAAKPKRVLFLMSDTGGGHRAAAQAIIDALKMKYGDQVETTMVDVFKLMAFPMNYQPELYPVIIKHGKIAWEVGYKMSNTPRRAQIISRSMYMTNGNRLKRMVREYPADVVVSTHSVITRPTMRAYRTLEYRPPCIVVVTDLVSTHMFWYDKTVERCLVPTQEAFERGLEAGLSPEQMRITGLPVHPDFTSRLKDKQTARKELGWDPDLPAVLLIGGGEGMGPLYKTARMVDTLDDRFQIAVVAGKNASLKADLEACDWKHPAIIYPFVNNMPTLMAAADVLVTKAGPGTISEACIAGLPMILSSAIPGQEEGNVDFVVNSGAGVYAPKPEAVAQALHEWLSEGAEGLARRAENAQRVAKPNAVWDIVEEVWHYAHQPPIKNQRKTLWRDVVQSARDLTSR